MSDLKTTETKSQVKEQDADQKELSQEDLNQISGGNRPTEGAQQNHNQTCAFVA